MDQHGCAKNQVDGELIATRLMNLGMEQTYEPGEADLIIVNSCGFIESAKTESLDSLMDARNAYPDAKIVLAGCLAERYAEDFRENLPEADGIFGNGDLTKIDDVVAELKKGNRPVEKPAQKGVCCGDRKILLNYKGSAFVKITEGCNNCCSFCAIPVIRGELRSRKISEIVDEIRELVAGGIFEINLIGQDLAAFGTGREDRDNFTDKGNSFLHDLLEEISKLQGKFWIRLLYIHPDHFNADILEVMKRDRRFLPYFDIPFQSGDDETILAMNRHGSAEQYRKTVETIRGAFEESCIRTTFLTGFPGETDEQAENTRKFLEAARCDWSGCFTYSEEENTAAEKMIATRQKKRVSAKKARQRADILSGIQAEITAELLNERCGRFYEVLVEEIVENTQGTDEGLAIGRAWFEAPEVDGNVVIRYDLDDRNAVEKIKPGAVVKVKAVASSGVDIDSVFEG